MKPENNSNVAHLLERWRNGDRSVLERLLPLVYADLRRMAAGMLRAHSGHGTLQTTALVHDVLLRLLDRPAADFESSAHLLNASARMMRQTLVDRARAAQSDKRGGGWLRDEFTAALELPIPDGTDLGALDLALNELESFDERMAKVVELRYFVGLGMKEIGGVLGIAERTARRDLIGAHAWLQERLNG
ncbi:MAG: ECF-type sigma factor [Dokdonella sp.]